MFKPYINLGGPEWLDCIHEFVLENIPDKEAKDWTMRLSKAIQECNNFEKVKTLFMIKCLEGGIEVLDQIKFDKTRYPLILKAVEDSREAATSTIKALESEDTQGEHNNPCYWPAACAFHYANIRFHELKPDVDQLEARCAALGAYLLAYNAMAPFNVDYYLARKACRHHGHWLDAKCFMVASRSAQGTQWDYSADSIKKFCKVLLALLKKYKRK